MNPYLVLANAIVELAAKDYKAALREYYSSPYGDASVNNEIAKLEQFFQSGWFGMLTVLDGEYLMNRIRATVREEVGACQQRSI